MATEGVKDWNYEGLRQEGGGDVVRVEHVDGVGTCVTSVPVHNRKEVTAGEVAQKGGQGVEGVVGVVVVETHGAADAVG